MKDKNTSINQVLTNFVQKVLNKERFYLELGIVQSVDEAELTCEFQPNGGDSESTVYLSVFESETYQIPEVNSLILVGYTDKAQKYMLQASKVDKIVFRDGANGELINIDDLTSKLNGLKDDVDKIYKALRLWTPVASDGGAALKAYYAGLGPTSPASFNKNDYKDDKILH
jgi:hypothetical protein